MRQTVINCRTKKNKTFGNFETFSGFVEIIHYSDNLKPCKIIIPCPIERLTRKDAKIDAQNAKKDLN